MANSRDGSDSKSEIVAGVLYSIAESDKFLVSSMRTDNAKELARELLFRVQGLERGGSGTGGTGGSYGDNSDEFSKFSCALTDKIIAISTPDPRLKSSKSQRKKIWYRFHVARSGELLHLWTCLFNKLKIVNSDIGKGYHR